MTAFDYTGVMWAEATRDGDAEAQQELLLRGKLATAAFWPFLAGAQSEAEFGHRLALVEDRVAAVVPGPVLEPVLASVASDWKALNEGRQEAARTAALERGERIRENTARVIVAQVQPDQQFFDRQSGQWVTAAQSVSAHKLPGKYTVPEDIAGNSSAVEGYRDARYHAANDYDWRHADGDSFSLQHGDYQQGYGRAYDDLKAGGGRGKQAYIDPSDAQRYSHYPDMNPPVDNGTLQGPDGFVTGGEGDAGRSDAVIQQRQLTPGQWTVTPGTEWPVRPNAGDPAQVPRTAHTNPYTTGERSECRSCNGWGRFENAQGPVCPDCGGQGYIERKSAGQRQAVERSDSWVDQGTAHSHSGADQVSAAKRMEEIRSVHGDEAADDFMWGYKTSKPQATAGRHNDWLATVRTASQLPPGLRTILATQSPRWEYDQLVKDYPHLLALAGEGIVPTPGPNPSYFSQGSEGIAGPPTFPENPSSAIEPKTDNRMDDLYGVVPPQASSGSAEGLVDGQGYSRQVPGSSATAGRRPFVSEGGGVKVTAADALPGDPVPTAHPDHQPIVPPWAGYPWCTCGFKQKGPKGKSLAEHLREFDPTYGQSKQAATDGRIVGHCDNCNQPVRYHTGEGGVDELRHLHNNHNRCSNGQKAASLRRSTAFFDPKDASVRVLADGMSRTRPTLDNPSGAGDEYDANTWGNAVTQRPMQSAEDRGINTPTSPREPIGTVSSDPGRDDDGNRNQNGMARETALAGRSIEDLMEV